MCLNTKSETKTILLLNDILKSHTQAANKMSSF